MDIIRATVQNGRIEPVDPLDLPEGTALLVFPRDSAGDQAEAWDDSPEAIAAWLRWYDSLQPLVFTPEQARAWKETMEERKGWELAHADARVDRLRDQWR